MRNGFVSDKSQNLCMNGFYDMSETNLFHIRQIVELYDLFDEESVAPTTCLRQEERIRCVYDLSETSLTSRRRLRLVADKAFKRCGVKLFLAQRNTR